MKTESRRPLFTFFNARREGIVELQKHVVGGFLVCRYQGWDHRFDQGLLKTVLDTIQQCLAHQLDGVLYNKQTDEREEQTMISVVTEKRAQEQESLSLWWYVPCSCRLARHCRVSFHRKMWFSGLVRRRHVAATSPNCYQSWAAPASASPWLGPLWCSR